MISLWRYVQLETGTKVALTYLLDTLGFDNFSNVLPMYLGDDRTDEDAFKVSFVKTDALFFRV